VETNLRFRSFDGTELEGTYVTCDSISDAIVILVHGITSSRDEFGLFSGLASHLENTGVPSFRFDYRCHGKSDRPMEAMTLSGIVNDIESAAALGLAQAMASRVHVVAMSFGGQGRFMVLRLQQAYRIGEPREGVLLGCTTNLCSDNHCFFR